MRISFLQPDFEEAFESRNILESTRRRYDRLLTVLNRYIVAFRSKRAEGSVDLDLYTADREAHEEAVTQGGLLAYCTSVPMEFTMP